MKKLLNAKLIAVFLIFTFCRSVVAYEDWLPGIKEYTLEAENIVSQSNVQSDGNVLTFGDNSEATYEFYMPFDACSIDISYECSGDAEFTIITDDAAEDIKLSAAANGSYEYVFNTVIRKGEKSVKILANKPIIVKTLVFNKKKVQTAYDDGLKYLCDLDENEDAIKTSVIIDTKASMIMVNGARRYINNNDVTQLCENIDGHIYLPIHTLARALGYYYENLPDRNYVLLRKEDKELVFKNATGCEEDYLFDKEDIENPITYINGEAYAPVRYFAEIVGMTVGYREGIAVIDDKYSVENIINNEGVFAYIKEQFKMFKPESINGTTYYVAQTEGASDDNDGSENAPFLTLNKAGEVAKAGDTVVVGEGVYRESLTVRNNGTQTNPITFIAKDGDNVVISATETISGFKADPNRDGVYKVPVSWNLGDGRNQIFIDNESLVEARYPNSPTIDTGDKKTLSDNWPVLGDLKVDAQNNLLVTSETLLNQNEEDYWKGAYFVTCRGNCYKMSTARVEASQYGSLTLTDTSKIVWDEGQSNVWNFGYLQGHINCLDEEGEWVISDGELYIIPYEDADINSFSVEMKKRQTVLDLSDNKYVHIKNINMFGGGIKMNNSEMCVINGCEIKYNNHYILSHDQANGYIDDADPTNPNGAVQRGEVGIYVGGRDNVFINNTIKEAAGAGIYASGSYMYIENNVIDGCGYSGSTVAGLTFMPNRINEGYTDKRGGHSIYQNTVCNVGRSAIIFTQLRGRLIYPFLPSEIAYNDFHDAMLTTLDVGIVYEYYAQMGYEKLKTRFHNNYVYYTLPKSNPYALGIYHDGGTQNVETYDNVVFTTDDTVYEEAIYTQTAENAYAACDVWNNSIHLSPVYGGPNSLKAEDFPYERPFFAGALMEGEEYLKNYNKVSERKHIYAKDAVLNGCTVEENNSVSFNNGNSTEYIEFKDVDFSENGANRLLIDYYGDKYNTGDKLRFVIGDSLSDGVSYEIKLKAKAENKEQINTVVAAFEKITGKQNVYLIGQEIKSAKITSIMPYLYTFDSGELEASRIYGGTFTDFVPVSQEVIPKRRYRHSEDGENPIVNTTYQNTILEYKNVNFINDVSKLGVSAAAPSGQSGQTMRVHLGSPDNEAVGEIIISETNDWHTYKENETLLKSIIPAGVYDVYLTFSGAGTCNLYWFGFKN